MQIQAPLFAQQALQLLNQAGHEAYLVGGCVRDCYLGRQPTDFDIATQATPAQMQQVFSDFPVLQTGVAHGTLTVMFDHQPVEITTFRADGPYSDGRRPDSVRFSRHIQEDLQRRDFTVNAMAWHPRQGLVDPFLGRRDCDARLLRAVGEPAQRFREDALRILRALRFVCTLGFAIEEDTLRAMRETAGGLRRIAQERVCQELNLALLGAHAGAALRRYPDILFLALPELIPMLHTPQRTPYHQYDVWEHTLRTLEETPRDPALRWAALFHDAGKPQTSTHGPDGTTHFYGHEARSVRLVEEAFLRLRQSRALTQEVAELVRHHDERIDNSNLRLWLSRLGPDRTLKLLRLMRADAAAHAPHIARQVSQIDALFEEAARLSRSRACLSLKDMAVKGNDLLALGYPADARLGQALSHLLTLVLTQQVPNNRDALLHSAREMLQEIKQNEAPQG